MNDLSDSSPSTAVDSNADDLMDSRTGKPVEGEHEVAGVGDDEKLSCTSRGKYILDWQTLGDRPWFEHPSFHRYWNHYRTVMDRTRSYQQKKTAHTFPQSQNGMHFLGYQWMPFMLPCYHGNPAPVLTPHQSAGREFNSLTFPVSNDRKGRKVNHPKTSRRKKRKRNSSSRSSSRASFSENTATDERELHEYEMHITDEMLEFFEASAKHRKERDAIRREEEQNASNGLQENDYIDIEGVTAATKSRASIRAPAEGPGMKRTAQMKMLYGKNAAMIHGMETAMQLTFDRNCDLKQPKLWPNMPLNLKF